MPLLLGGLSGGGLTFDSLFFGRSEDDTPTPTPTPATGWESARLYDRFLMRMGRGNGGVVQADELWTATRIYEALADAQEAVFEEMIPMVPLAFVGPPVQLTSADGGVTYDFPSYPFGHVEVFARLASGRELVPSKFNGWGDFLLEGDRLRTPGNRQRAYSSGPWARYCGLPTTRLSADDEPELFPAAARELILLRACIVACDNWGASLDSAPFEKRYAEVRMRWLTLWKTQSARQGSSGTDPRWWLTLSRFNT